MISGTTSFKSRGPIPAIKNPCPGSCKLTNSGYGDLSDRLVTRDLSSRAFAIIFSFLSLLTFFSETMVSILRLNIFLVCVDWREGGGGGGGGGGEKKKKKKKKRGKEELGGF